ncbi:MAG: deaminase [Burkholderiales bacterium PBB4]|nr:MAG: deaminase [Burkholderiales bacterium PBB4]
MRKIRVFEHVSVDGVISPGDRGEYGAEFAHGGWTAPYRSPEGAGMVLAAQGPSFDLLLGRTTYDLWAAYWPKAGSFPMAQKLNAATKYVATHRPDSLTWGPVGTLGHDVFAGIQALKAQEGPDLIVWGSASLAAELLRQGLVDELVLIVYPVLLGRGLRFFAQDAAPCELSLVSSQATSTGLHLNTYRCVGPLRTA